MIASIFRHRYRIAMTVIFAILCLHALSGCKALGLAESKTFSQDYAYALGQTTAILKASSQALDARQISIRDAQYVLQVTDQSKAYLDTAKQVYEAGDALAGKTQLELATNVLLQLQSFLNSRAAK